MKRIAFFSLTVFCCIAFFASISLIAQEIDPLKESATGARFTLLKKDGTPIDQTAEKNCSITVNKDSRDIVVKFDYNDKPVRYTLRFDSEKKRDSCKVESPLLKDGTLLVGFQFPKEKRMPEAKVDGNRAKIQGKVYGFSEPIAASVVWQSDATLTSPKPRKELTVSLAEYGATDTWKDVTRIVNEQLSCDSLNFHGTNVLFEGDPAPGVVKSLVLTYSLDDDEELKEYGENAPIRIQFDSKDQFFRLAPKDTESFEFFIETSKSDK